MLILNNYEANKLDHIEVTLEKTIKTLIHKYEQSIPKFQISDISELYVNAEKLRLQETVCMKQRIQNIAKSLKSKLGLLENKKISEIKDFEKFKLEMVDIQDNIMNMKRTSQAELYTLGLLENDLNDELNIYYNEKVAKWNQSLDISNHEFVPSKVKNKSHGQYKEVKQFLDFVHQSGGHENGWRKEDHLLFLKLRTKYKKIDDVAFYLNDMLPDISVEEIKVHEDWYKKYLHLQSKKKEAILTWKHNNNDCKHVNMTTIESKENNNLKTVQGGGGNLREKLTQWKMEKEEKLYTEQELEKQRILANIEKDRLKKQRQIEMKKIVNEWRESKITYEQSEKQHQRLCQDMEKKRRAANANKLIKQFQSMDELHILKMRHIHKKLTDEPKKRVQSGPPVPRDPQRLMQPTIQWAQRVRAVRELSLNGPLPIFATSKLAIPEWRKSIM